MPVASNYSAQILIEDNGINYVGLVNAALATIAGQPRGAQLLNDIIANAPAVNAWGGAKLLIIWPFKKVYANNADMVGQKVVWCAVHGGDRRTAGR